MPIERCPACDRLPADCKCPPGDRWIALDGLWLHLTADGFVDVRVFAETVGERIREAIPTIRAWAERLYRDGCVRGGDLVAELEARNRAGESWADLAAAVDRRIAGHLARIHIDEISTDKEIRKRFQSFRERTTAWKDSLTLDAARTFVWSDLREVYGDERALETTNDLIEAVQRGDEPFEVVEPGRVAQEVTRWREYRSR